jgi:hypothetical protein
MGNNKPNRTPRKGRAVAYEPSHGDVSQSARRAFFLETVRKCESKVLEDLSQEPMRFFREAGLGQPDIDARTFSNIWAKLASERWHRSSSAAFVWLRRTLWEWGKRWKLSEEWCLKAAFHTLIDWMHDPELASELSWSLMIYSGGYVVRPIPNEDRFSFEHQGWQLTKYPTREKYEDVVRAAFDTALKAYCDYIEEAAPQDGYVAVPPLKFSKKPHLPFEWLVRQRAQGWTLYKINKKYYPNSRTDNRARIKQGINEVAALIGLPSSDFSPD